MPKNRLDVRNSALKHGASFASTLARSLSKNISSPKNKKFHPPKREPSEEGQNILTERQNHTMAKDFLEVKASVSYETKEIIHQKINLHLVALDKAAFVLNDGPFKHTRFEVERHRYRLKLTSTNSDNNTSKLFGIHRHKLKDQLKEKGMDLVSWEII